jgi:hypothetical protein
MNNKIAKLLRKYAEVKHLKYDICKKIYDRANHIEKGKYIIEIQNIIDAPTH